MLIRRAAYDNLVQQCERSNNCIEQLKRENAALLIRIQLLEMSLQTSTDSIDHLQRENQQLHSELQDQQLMSSQIAAEDQAQNSALLKCENADLRSTLHLYQKKLQDAETEVKHIRRENQQFRDELELHVKGQETDCFHNSVDKREIPPSGTHSFQTLDDLTSILQGFPLDELRKFTKKTIETKQQTEKERSQIDSERASLLASLANIQNRAEVCKQRLSLFVLIQDGSEGIPFDVDCTIANMTVNEICRLDIWSKRSTFTIASQDVSNGTNAELIQGRYYEYKSELRKYYRSFGKNLIKPAYTRILRNMLISKEIITSQVTEEQILSDIKQIVFL